MKASEFVFYATKFCTAKSKNPDVGRFLDTGVYNIQFSEDF